jgi:hypothetical protein
MTADPQLGHDALVLPEAMEEPIMKYSTADLRDGIHRFVKGWASDCPVHGYEGTEPTYRKVMGFEDRS